MLNDLDKADANKAIIRSFLVNVFQNKNHDALSKYVPKNEYIQHNANVPNGIEALEQFLDTEDFNYDFVFHVMGQGNHVVSYSKATYNNQEFSIFDIFRIKDGKIMGHWDNMESTPPF